MRGSLAIYKFATKGAGHLNIRTQVSELRNLAFCVWRDWRRQWHPTPVLLPGKSHGQRSLVGCSPWGHTTQRFHFRFSLWCIGVGNGNPLQCSCLENPRDGGAWWAAAYGVAQSRTRLKWLSSSSSHIITIVKDIYQFSQPIARPKKKKHKDSCKPQCEHD